MITLKYIHQTPTHIYWASDNLEDEIQSLIVKLGAKGKTDTITFIHKNDLEETWTRDPQTWNYYLLSPEIQTAYLDLLVLYNIRLARK